MAGSVDTDPEFQIAPMIDVMLVLMIFFMSITTAQVLKVDKSITLPVAENGVKKDNTRAEAIVNVRWDAAKHEAAYAYNDRVYTELSKLTDALTEARKISQKASSRRENPEFRVVIRGDREGNVSSVTRAMNAAAEAGIADISFSTINRE